MGMQLDRHPQRRGKAPRARTPRPRAPWSRLPRPRGPRDRSKVVRTKLSHSRHRGARKRAHQTEITTHGTPTLALTPSVRPAGRAGGAPRAGDADATPCARRSSAVARRGRERAGRAVRAAATRRVRRAAAATRPPQPSRWTGGRLAEGGGRAGAPRGPLRQRPAGRRQAAICRPSPPVRQARRPQLPAAGPPAQQQQQLPLGRGAVRQRGARAGAAG
jgi:hypothetical protein